jgi:curved DNA-binding protein
MADGHDRFSSLRDTAGNTPRQGADAEHKVAVTLKEAYCGTTRLLEKAGGRRIAVEIPPGVATGTRVRFTGYGKRGNNGGAPGDLYLLIEVRPCQAFERRGDDLYSQCSLNLAELALGSEVRISTLNGRILTLAVPAGTEPGKRFRLAGQGMPKLRKPEERGDLYVTVNMKLPARLSRKQYALLRHLGGEAVSAPAGHTSDDSISLIVLAVIFLAGIGAGLLLYWLILD